MRSLNMAGMVLQFPHAGHEDSAIEEVWQEAKL